MIFMSSQSTHTVSGIFDIFLHSRDIALQSWIIGKKKKKNLKLISKKPDTIFADHNGTRTIGFQTALFYLYS